MRKRKKDDLIASNSELGSFIKNLRLRERESEDSFAQSLGVGRGVVRGLEAGKVTDAGLEVLGKLIAKVPQKEDQDNLRAMLLRTLLGEVAPVLVPDIAARPLPQNLAVQALLGAVQIFKGYDQKAEVLLVDGVIVGATISLIQCIDLFAKNPRIEPHAWDYRIVADNLEKMVTTKYDIDWSYSPHFNLWSLGFFLNKAMTNVAHVIEQVTRKWLEKKQESTEGDLASQLERLGTALRTAQNDAAATKILALMVNLRDANTIHVALGELHQSEVQSIRHELARDGLSSPERLGTIFQQLFVDELAQRGCVAVACIRGWLFEYATKSPARRNSDFVIEWVAAARATVWAAEFSQLMLDDIGIPRTELS